MEAQRIRKETSRNKEMVKEDGIMLVEEDAVKEMD